LRLTGRDRIARALYITAIGRRIVVVRAFVKKTQKTPRAEIDWRCGKQRRSYGRPPLGESFGHALGALCAAGSRNYIHRHCERSEAIHCHLLYGKMDCFASLAMTKNR
jgi:Phage derived protein Gp49-like (DUF891)